MKKILFMLILALVVLQADVSSKNSSDANITKKIVKKDTNKTVKTKEEILKEELKKQMELEAKYAREQRFYQGKDYNLTEKQIDKKILKDVPVIEPDYDFDITDVYRDDK